MTFVGIVSSLVPRRLDAVDPMELLGQKSCVIVLGPELISKPFQLCQQHRRLDFREPVVDGHHVVDIPGLSFFSSAASLLRTKSSFAVVARTWTLFSFCSAMLAEKANSRPPGM